MSYISNAYLLKNIPTNDVDMILEYIQISIHLLRKFGKKILDPKVLSQISDQNLRDFIDMIHKTGRFNIKSLKKFEGLVKKNFPDYKKDFVLSSKKDIGSDLNNMISKKFDKFDIKFEKSEILWLSLSGEWFYYKKSLDNDLSKLLD